MSELHLRHIQKHLEDTFVAHIDVTDISRQVEEAKVSRALVAFGVATMTDCAPSTAAAAVTDGFDDNGIDAIYFDRPTARLFLLQGKFSKGKNAMSLGDLEKYIQGVRDLLRGRLEKFNDKVRALARDINDAIESAETNIILGIVSTAVQPLSPAGLARLDEYLQEVNDASEIASKLVLGQGELHRLVVSGRKSGPIKLTVVLRNWGRMREPYGSFFGVVSASDLSEWWTAHRSALFTDNIRRFLGDSEINVRMQDTILSDPTRFWYYNNGITLLCDKVAKAPLGGNDRDVAILECEGVRVVNGAQTVGTIGRAAALSTTALTEAYVLVRIVSLSGAPADLAGAITIATNTQNRVQSRDFVSLDPQQQRLADELTFEGVSYLFKSGDAATMPKQFRMEDATVALACAHPDLKMAVTAKGQVGTLWEDVSRAPYRALFNPGVRGEDLWRKVQVMRRVDEVLARERDLASHERRQIAIHGNRFLLRQVYRYLEAKDLRLGSADIDHLTTRLLDVLEEVVNDVLKEPYLAWTFKNQGKCKLLEQELWKSLDEAVPATFVRTATGRTLVDPLGQQELPFGQKAE